MSFPGQSIDEESPKIAVVRTFLEIEASAIGQVLDQHLLPFQAITQLVKRGRRFHLHEFVHLHAPRKSFGQALPWQGASHEVDQNEAQGLKVVPAALQPRFAGVEAGISHCAFHGLALLEVHVLAPGRRRVAEALRHPEVDEVHEPRILPVPDEEVLRLDVTVHPTLCVERLEALDGLVGQHAHGLEAEPPPAKMEQLLEGCP
mmetsp:Transcript_2391/g.5971  ORF Transcript_2391/g.5971 Transcript_2391/m.5971 type:complete len:203 (-) Transcript_2391:393-1001(-)|eukprot:CAMPEP_0183393204 /NCGR_PEP_ID=MMETSP0370-20130417/7787_1 /TAXON_ID=268820 /ORGANISM="Peridinium aciculiferum, Strain PAER-2" /LENGTH=202 /DNA_ID=CAMNT_0025573377 /DNA_START=300 /DNA_END=908 /DNA_ORIENTATION=-